MNNTSLSGIMALVGVFGIDPFCPFPWEIPSFVWHTPRRRKYQRRIKQPRRIAGRLQPKRRRKA